jgi:hypothetical protein
VQGALPTDAASWPQLMVGVWLCRHSCPLLPGLPNAAAHADRGYPQKRAENHSERPLMTPRRCVHVTLYHMTDDDGVPRFEPERKL